MTENTTTKKHLDSDWESLEDILEKYPENMDNYLHMEIAKNKENMEKAHMTLEAEIDVKLEHMDGDPPLKIPYDRIKDFQREWRRRPYLRYLIRAADDPVYKGIRTHTGLLELLQWMALSPEWRREEGGRLDCGFIEALEALGKAHDEK